LAAPKSQVAAKAPVQLCEVVDVAVQVELVARHEAHRKRQRAAHGRVKRRVGVAPCQIRQLQTVRVDRNFPHLRQFLRASGVVEVAVRQDDEGGLGTGSEQILRRLADGLSFLGNAGVHQNPLASAGQKVGVDNSNGQASDAVCNLAHKTPPTKLPEQDIGHIVTHRNGGVCMDF
jgi:hypothetical protein